MTASTVSDMFLSVKVKNLFKAGKGIILSLFMLSLFFAVSEASASSGGNSEFRSMFLEFSQQTITKVKNENGPDDKLKEFVADTVSASLFRLFSSDPDMMQLSADIQFSDIVKAKGKYLNRFSVLDLAQCYSEHGSSFESFYSGLKTLGVRRNIILNWANPEIKEAAFSMYKCLKKVYDKKLGLSSRRHYDTPELSGEVRFSWYPLSGHVYLYCVATFKKDSAVRTIIINSSGNTAFSSSKPYAVHSSLTQCSMNMSMRKIEAFGKWSQPDVQGGDGKTSLFVDNNCRLKINGTEVRGRVIENIAVNNRSLKPFEIEYVLTGTLDAFGNMKGRCVLKGDKFGYSVRFGSSVSENAYWKGTIRNNSIQGSIIMSDGAVIKFNASVGSN